MFRITTGNQSNMILRTNEEIKSCWLSMIETEQYNPTRIYPGAYYNKLLDH